MSDARALAGRLWPAVPAVLAALLLALLLPREVPAQGLGDAAAHERARREARPKDPAKVFTDQDLPTPEDEKAEEGEGGEEEEGDETPQLSKIGAADPLRAELDRRREERALQEREWRARFAEARARVREAEARCWQEVVRTQFRDGIPVQMKVQEFVESEEFRQAKQDLADLQEEFRRTGSPAGWARE